MNQTEKKTWWSKNWKWFVPSSCIGFIGLVSTFILIIYFVFGFMKSSDVYENALDQVRRSTAVKEALGSPLKEGLMFSGNIKVSGSSGKADLSIPLAGPKGKGTIYATATKIAGKWEFSSLALVIDGSNNRIDLLGER
jgi:hypothetical protein